MRSGGPALEVPLIRHTTCSVSTRIICTVSLARKLLVKFEWDEIENSINALRQRLGRKLRDSLE